jgi:zinc/manganese transport system substrate-binding protein
MSRTHITINVAAMTALLLAACAAPGDHPQGSSGRDDRLAVVATTTQVGALADEIGGDDIALTVLIEPGVEAHDFELSPANGAALEAADLVLVSGAGLEDWLSETLATIGVEDRVVDLSEGIELRTPGEGEPAQGHDDQEASHDDEASHGEEDEPGHGEEVDPHYWLSAPNAVRMAENVRDALAGAGPDSADAFGDRADVVIDRLLSADEEIRELIAEVPEDQRNLVTDHDALGYFIDEYGLTFVGSVFPSLDVSSEPSAQEIEALVADIRQHEVRAIFTESSVNPTLAQAVADETDAHLVEQPLYTDSLGPEGSGADTIDGMLVHNARVIRDGLLGG